MAQFRIPLERAEQGRTGGGEFDWGEGLYEGTIEVVRIREVHSHDEGGPKFVLQPGENEAEVASIQLGSITPVEEGLPNPGNQKFFDDLIILSVDRKSFAAYEDGDNWRLDQARNHLGNLAHAVGLTDVVEDGGESYAVPTDDFEDIFRVTEGEDGLAGQRVLFRVGKNKIGKPQLMGFQQTA